MRTALCRVIQHEFIRFGADHIPRVALFAVDGTKVGDCVVSWFESAFLSSDGFFWKKIGFPYSRLVCCST